MVRKPFSGQIFGGLIPRIFPRDQSKKEPLKPSPKPSLLLSFRKLIRFNDYGESEREREREKGLVRDGAGAKPRFPSPCQVSLPHSITLRWPENKNGA